MNLKGLGNNFFLIEAKAPTQLTPFNQRENTNLNIINFGTNNKFPNELIAIINESPIATACVATKAKYMTGDGIVVAGETPFAKRLAAIITNRKWESICNGFAPFEAVGLRYKFNGNGNIIDILPTDYASIRLGLPNTDDEIHKAFVSKNWPLYQGKSKVNRDLYTPKEIDIWRGEKTVREIQELADAEPLAIKDHKGALKIVRRERPGQLYYTNPKIASAQGWIYVDGQVQIFHVRNVDNGFNPNMLIYVPFDLSGVDEETGESKMEAFKKQVKDKWLGAENGGTPAVLQGMDKESAPQIIPFQNNGNDKLYISLADLIVDHICTVTSTPPIIANIRVSKGLSHSAQDIINEFDKYLFSEVRPDQNLLLEAINEDLKHWEGYDKAMDVDTKLMVSNSRPLQYIPDNQMNDYTEDERRAANGYEPKKETAI
jgi:hypothetical protein